MDMINNIVPKITCLIILDHFFHSQSLIETIIWKHQSNNITKTIKGSNSITLYIKSFTNTIGASHWNHSVSIQGRFSPDTGSQSQNDKVLSKSAYVFVLSESLGLYSDIRSFCQHTKKSNHDKHMIANTDIIFLLFIVVKCM